MKRFLKWILAGLVFRVLLVVVVLIGMLFGLSSMASLDNVVYDQLVKLRPMAASERVAVVAIDEESIKQIGSWPWPRTYLAEVTDLLAQQGATAVGLHLLLPENEWNPGLAGMRTLRRKFNLNVKKTLIGRSLVEMENSIDGDNRLQQALKSSKRVVIPYLFIPEVNKTTNRPPGFSREVSEPTWQKSLATLHNPFRNWNSRESSKGILPGFLSLSQATRYQGHINYLVDSSDRVRRLSLLKPLADRYYPAFALQLFALAENQKQPVIKQERGSLFVNGQLLTAGDDFQVYANPVREKSIKRFSFIDLINGNLAEETFKGKVVLIGLTASPMTAGGTVFVAEPPPVVAAASIVADLLASQQISRPYWAFLLEAAALIYLGIFIVLVLPRLKLGLGWLLQLTFLASWIGIVASLLALKGLWFQLAPHFILSIAGLVLITLQRTMTRQGLNFEDLKMLGLSFQSQGMLDMAFDKFMQCPVSDKSIKEILYNLGLDFERKRMFNKAIAVYTHLLKGGRFKDAKKKVTELQKMENSIVLGGNGSKDGTMILGRGSTTPTLGRYEVVRELGQGAMGTVYLGRDPKINREVAIKTLNLHDVEADQLKDVKERFFREAEAAGRLNHPHIVTIYDAGEEHDLAYLAMEYLVGKDLSAHCSKKKLLPVSTVLQIAAEVADALAYAHKHDIVHRDIKPSNLMLLKNGQVKVTDFGIARVVNSSQTQTGTILGTPSYMSPEQVSGEKVRGRSDLFSLGVVCYELLSGQKPFVGDSLGALMHNIANVKYDPLKKVNPKLPECCYAVVRKLLKKDFKDRFRNATEVADALRKCIEKAG